MAPALNLPAPTHGADNTLAPTANAAASSSNAADTGASQTPKFSSGGIIYPPPELRRTIDKAAELIAKKDPAFETSIKQAEANNPKFAFLKDDDAYHAYYVSRRDAVRRGETLTDTPAPDAVSATPGVNDQQGNTLPQEQAPEEPEPFEFSADLPNITAVDLDILKLTALFTARKGRSFATSLLARESKSFQFEFLRPSHSLYGYFNRLVEQYQNIISPSPQLLEKVKIGAYGTANPPASTVSSSRDVTGPGKGGARPVLLEQIKKRAEWERWSREKRKKIDEDQEKERAAFNEIDWQDFVVVGTVELTETDQHVDLPPPRSLREMESMTLAQKRMASMIMESEAGNVDEEEVEELEMPGSSSKPNQLQSATESTEQQRPPVPAPPPGIKIRKDYVPRGLAGRNKPAAPATTKCPVCGEQVPIDEMAEHVRFELLNPQYREQRQQLETKKAQQAALQAGADPSYYLKQLASSRTDIFGDEEDEQARLAREAEERRLAKEKEKIIWDGHAKSRGTARELYAKNLELEAEMKRLNQKPQTVLPEYGPSIPGQAKPDSAAEARDGRHGTPGGLAGSSLPAKPVSSAVASGEAERAASPALAAGVKRAAEEPEPAGQPPLQRRQADSTTALATASVSETVPSPSTSTPSSSSQSIRITIQIDSSTPDLSGKSFNYTAPLDSTISALRDFVHTDILAGSIAASKLKIKVAGKPATLRQTLAASNLADGDSVVVNVAK